MAAIPSVPVRPGQLWADNDPRASPRTVRVESIEGDRAVVIVETTAHSAYNPGARTRIKLARFRPTSTGYRLVEDVETEDSNELLTAWASFSGRDGRRNPSDDFRAGYNAAARAVTDVR